MKTKILVTGAAGFIGSSLSAFLLKEGHRVIGIDNFDPFYSKEIKYQNISDIYHHPQFTFKEIDFTVPKQLDKLPKVDIVIHLGAKAGVRPSIEAPQDYIHTNIHGTNAVLEWMRKMNIKKMVFASSSSVYGNHHQVPFSEDVDVRKPISPYAFTKQSCELMNYSYHHLYQFDMINLRFFTVFGPRQRPDLAIHKFVNKMSMGEEIHMYGDGSTARDYTFIDDIVSGINAAIQYVLQNKDVYESVNLGNHTPVSLQEMIRTIENALDTEAHVIRMPMQSGDVDITFADINKAKKLIGYNPQTSFKSGIEQFVEWYHATRKVKIGV